MRPARIETVGDEHALVPHVVAFQVLIQLGSNQGNLNALVQGNDFHGNKIGVKYSGSGSTTVNAPLSGSPADMIWTVTGTGGDVWGATDPGFQFAHTTLTGDGGITARRRTRSSTRSGLNPISK